MIILVDTCVWSLAFRRDTPSDHVAVRVLERVLTGSDIVVTTGIIVQELLQGALPSKARGLIEQRLLTLPLLHPTVEDHVKAAGLRNTCRKHGIQLGTIDALIMQLSLTNKAHILTVDKDFTHASKTLDLSLIPIPSP
ncbi:MAG: PIN domain-containing protein [Actinomycetaceae bacterium]|nr:PIN domain-containing protein [Actinomycetaceae bacterium]